MTFETGIRSWVKTVLKSRGIEKKKNVQNENIDTI